MQSAFSRALATGRSLLRRLPVAAGAQTGRNRCLSTAAKGIPLTQEFPGIPPINILPSGTKHKTLITRLDNGIRVASQDTYGAASCFSVYVDTGVKYETDAVHGISHLFERLTFKVRGSISLGVG